MMKNKKIKIVIGIYSFIVGGAQRQLTEQFKFFNFDKFDFHLIVMQQFRTVDNFYNLLPENVKVYKLDFKGFRDFKNWKKLINILKKIKPNIVISSLFFSNTIFRILKIFFRYKIISREHNTYIDKTKFQILVDRLLSLITCRIVAVSEDVANFTSKQERIKLDKFMVIRNGVNVEKLEKIREQYNKNNLKSKFNFDKADKIIINVARLSEQKNQKLLINAFAYFTEKFNKKYKLIILGEGGLRKKLSEQIKSLKLENKVSLLGNKENIFEYYMISDFLVSTSLIEGLSNAYLEAMALGLPIISTKTAGTSNLILEGVNGFFIDGYNQNLVVGALVKIDRSDLNLLSLATIEHIKNFDIRNTVKKYENLFRECLNH